MTHMYYPRALIVSIIQSTPAFCKHSYCGMININYVRTTVAQKRTCPKNVYLRLDDGYEPFIGGDAYDDGAGISV